MLKNYKKCKKNESQGFHKAPWLSKVSWWI